MREKNYRHFKTIKWRHATVTWRITDARWKWREFRATFVRWAPDSDKFSENLGSRKMCWNFWGKLSPLSLLLRGAWLPMDHRHKNPRVLSTHFSHIRPRYEKNLPIREASVVPLDFQKSGSKKKVLRWSIGIELALKNNYEKLFFF